GRLDPAVVTWWRWAYHYATCGIAGSPPPVPDHARPRSEPHGPEEVRARRTGPRRCELGARARGGASSARGPGEVRAPEEGRARRTGPQRAGQASVRLTVHLVPAGPDQEVQVGAGARLGHV